jgi:GNAT superfamily N-acetyltransferase
MNLSLRSGRPEDAQTLGTICYQAFKSIAEKHNFPPDIPHPEAAIGLISFMLSQKNVYSVVAEIDGHMAGSNFLSENDPVAGVGPVTVDPHLQNSSVGRKLMENVLQRGEEGAFVGVRLVQAAYHNRSLALYTKLGFDVKEPLSQMQGPAIGITFAHYPVRLAQEADIEACNQVCIQVHGHHRGGELLGAIKSGTAKVVEHKGGITGYTTGVGFFGHAVGKTNQDLQALIGASADFSGPGFLLPTRNAALMRWCLSHGLRVVQPMTLMSKGFYKQPNGVFLSSILF